MAITPEMMAEAQLHKQRQRDAEIQKRWIEDAPKRAEYDTRVRLEATSPELLETLRNLVEAFLPGEDGIDQAREIGVDAELFAARVLLRRIEEEKAEIVERHTPASGEE